MNKQQRIQKYYKKNPINNFFNTKFFHKQTLSDNIKIYHLKFKECKFNDCHKESKKISSLKNIFAVNGNVNHACAHLKGINIPNDDTNKKNNKIKNEDESLEDDTRQVINTINTTRP